MNQRGYSLRAFGVGEAFKEAVSGAKDGKGHFWAVDERGETFVMAFAGFAEEHGLNAAAGTQCFFDEAHTFDADEAAFGWQAATQSDTKLLEPAIVAAGEERRLADGARVTSGFARSSHHCGA